MSRQHLLFNPGPTNVHETVRQALLAPDMNHRDPPFTDALKYVCEQLVHLTGGRETHECIPFVASGTGANEAALAVVHGRMLVLVAGRYSERLADIADRLGLDFDRLTFDPLSGIEIGAVEAALDRDPAITHLCFVHHETTTSVMAPLDALTELARARNILTIVDGISSVFGHPFDFGANNVDVCTVTANKCLEGLPGLSFVLARRSFVEESKDRSRSYYFNLYRQWHRIKHDGKPPFTHAIPLYFATVAAIERLRHETVDGRIARYRHLKAKLRSGLAELEFAPVDIPEHKQCNILQLVHKPKALDFRALHDFLLSRGITIYTDQGTLDAGYLFFATMGAIEEADVVQFLVELRYALDDQGILLAQPSFGGARA